MSEPIMSLKELTPFVDGLDHPECVTWGPDGYVYAGGEAGQIYRVGLDGSVVQIGTTGGFILGVCTDQEGNVYACDTVHHAVMRVEPSGQSRTYCSGSDQRRMVTPNYAVFDVRGNLYVSDSGDRHKNNGCLWVIRPSGLGQILRTDVTAFPNGLALSEDERFLYIAVSAMPGVVRVALEEGVSAGSVETVVELHHQVPDGLAFDAGGNLYIACYTPDVILRLDRSGRLETLAEDWERVTLAAPTNVTFAGPNLDVLVVASLGRWHLSKAQMLVRGQPYNYPRSLGCGEVSGTP